MFSTYAIAALLAAVALGTFLWQSEAWKRQQRQSLAGFETSFYRQRHRRRMQISVLLAIVAVAMAVGVWLSNPLVWSIFWFGVLAVLVWIIVLAMLDASSSHVFFDRIRSRHLAEQAALQRELLEQARRRAGGDQTPLP